MDITTAEKILIAMPPGIERIKFMQTFYNKCLHDNDIDRYLYWSDRIISDGWIFGKASPENRKTALDLIFKAHCSRGRNGSFHDYLIAIEFWKPFEKKFYEPRAYDINGKEVLRSLVCDLQDLYDRVILGLAISMPPRTGKSELEKRFIAFVMGMKPSGSTFFASHTNPMANKFYREICMLIEDPSYCYKDIFPGVAIVDKSAEDKYIDIGEKETYKSFYARGIDGNMSGILEANELLCCDDLIRDSEEARNPDRVKTAVIKYAEDIKQRRKNEFVLELHIGTRWATQDVIGCLQEEHSEDERWRFRKIPALDENGNSNFLYRVDPMTAEHFHMIKRTMFMADGNDISFNCIYQQEPADREGILFPAGNLNYYGKLPNGTPDRIIMAVDIAWGGNDYFSAPIGFMFGNDIYIDRVIHVNREMATKDKTQPRVVREIIANKITSAHFEANNGGDEYTDRIRDGLREHGYRCNVTDARVPTNKSKNDRIVSCTTEIMGLNPDGYRFLYRRNQSGEYAVFMRHLTNYNQSGKHIGKQFDDAADALSSMVINLLGTKPKLNPIKIFDRALLRL